MTLIKLTVECECGEDAVKIVNDLSQNKDNDLMVTVAVDFSVEGEYNCESCGAIIYVADPVTEEVQAGQQDDDEESE
jgi:hypothetical protein